jgi:hypothetical protein
MRKGKRSSRKGSGRGMGCCWAEKRVSRQGLLYLAQQRQEPRRRIWLQTQIGQTTPWTLLPGTRHSGSVWRGSSH